MTKEPTCPFCNCRMIFKQEQFFSKKYICKTCGFLAYFDIATQLKQKKFNPSKRGKK